MSNYVVMLFYIYILKLNEIYNILFYCMFMEFRKKFCMILIIIVVWKKKLYNLFVILWRYKVILRILIEIDFLL